MLKRVEGRGAPRRAARRRELSSEEEQELSEAFRLFDSEATGRIDYHELKVRVAPRELAALPCRPARLRLLIRFLLALPSLASPPFFTFLPPPFALLPLPFLRHLSPSASRQPRPPSTPLPSPRLASSLPPPSIHVSVLLLLPASSVSRPPPTPRLSLSPLPIVTTGCGQVAMRSLGFNVKKAEVLQLMEQYDLTRCAHQHELRVFTPSSPSHPPLSYRHRHTKLLTFRLSTHP